MTSGSNETVCSGDQEDGVILSGTSATGLQSFVFRNLTFPIAPAAGSDGIFISFFGANGAGGTPGIFGENVPALFEVELASGGTINLSGSDANGILVHSFAGHGGFGQESGGLVYPSGRGGYGGPIFVETRTGTTINGSGPLALGIGAISRGGNSGSSTGSVEFAGGGGIVDISNHSTMTFEGDASIGIFALSQGGFSGTPSTQSNVIPNRGGHAAGVDVTNYNDIFMLGAGSTGILAESNGGHGGGGGDGGDSAVRENINNGDLLSGFARIEITNYATISTSGFLSGGVLTEGDTGDATGIEARAIGGNGGNGIDSSGDGPAGNGGDGGDGGRIRIENLRFGNISTGLIDVFGVAVTALSQGGSGGTGDSEGLFEGSGRNGGNGGSTRAIDFTNTGEIFSGTGGMDIDAAGARLQALGGDGGAGGSAADAFGITGGRGGAGGDAGDIDADVSGWILTGGSAASGNTSALDLFTRGGKGGAGGDAGGLFDSDGGEGGDAGNGGDITVDISGGLFTQGKDSAALRAQSIGGIGGVGGGVDFDLIGGDGGYGGAGGHGGVIAVTITSDILNMNGSLEQIRTSGEASAGILAQSIGGGSGGGGGAIGLFVSAGNAVSGGDGGVVTVDNDGGEIITFGKNSSHGIAALSIGGGGGSAGSAGGIVGIGGTGGAGGDGDLVTVINSGSVETRGDDSHGLFGTSVGGGGGDGGDGDGLVGIGGSNHVSGSGSKVLIENSGSIAVRGSESKGILALSVGGGGGSGGGAGGLFSMGGNSGASGHGDDVIVSNLGASSSIIAFNGIGIQAQSVGGGGGTGGSATGIGVAVGGDGGAAGNGATVTVGNEGTIQTGSSFVEGSGDNAHGIFAQSIGGGGGSSSDTLAFSAGFSLAVGGDGGAGGNGDAVTVNMGSGSTTSQMIEGMSFALDTAEVSTFGHFAHGIFGQSAGGGGGGAGLTGAVSAGSPITASVAIGGAGGAAGDGSLVDMNISGRVSTVGASAYGVFGQSVGGGGGNAGTTFAGSIAVGQQLAISVAVAIGGSGGAGGSADDVDISIDEFAFIETMGEDAHGVVAQSVGGGGGTGGNTYAFTGAFSLGPTATATFALGGSGGGGGAGKAAIVDNAGIISTSGDDARGIFAQSIGGGGGLGGNATTGSIQIQNPEVPIGFGTEIAIGGSGGAGRIGGLAKVNNSGSVYTQGESAGAIFAQSVGGGGGDGGSGDVGGIPVIGSFSFGEVFGLQIAVGGTGGTGGHGGVVDVDNSGLLSTQSEFSTGIFAQSVGGGGGTGALAGAGADGEISIGGNGGAAGRGGAIDVLNDGDIYTQGDYAHGIFAQSVGGGGGTAGHANFGSETDLLTTAASGAASGAKTAFETAGKQGLNRAGKLKAMGRGALKGAVTELFAPNLGISIGGKGGASGDGGAIQLTNTGVVDLAGNGVYGLFAQSIGGGGGTGGNGTFGLTGQIGFAGAGGSAGNGGAVTINNSGSIGIDGIGAYGILAQSVGGGGGISGDISFVVSTAAVEDSLGSDQPSGLEVDGSGLYVPTGMALTDLDAAKAAFDAFSANAGNGGKVIVESAGLILIGSDEAAVDPDLAEFSAYAGAGIFAQSVGGGGGILGLSNDESVDAFTFAGTKGGLGAAGNVHVNHVGDIIVNTIDGYGIFAQSVGCTQATIDTLESVAASISALNSQVPSWLRILVPTVDPAVCSNSNGDIEVSVSGGLIQGGGGAFGAGIFVDEGKNNKITVASSATVTALNGDAIISMNGNEAVFNNGTVIGNVELGGGVNSFDNVGRFDAGYLVDLGGGLLSSTGILSPGGFGAAMATRIVGDLNLADSNIYEFDVFFGAGASDNLEVDGAISLGGGLVPNILSLNDTSITVPVISTDELFTDQSFGTMSIVDQSSLLNFSLTTSGSDLLLGVEVDQSGFQLENLSESQAETIASIVENLSNGDSDLGFLFAYLGNLESTADLQAAIDSLGGDLYSSTLGDGSTGLDGFAGGSFSCENTGIAASWKGPEGQCYWSRVVGQSSQYDPSLNNAGFSQDSSIVAFGFQKKMTQHVYMGLSLGFEEKQSLVGTYARSETDTTYVGATFKYFGDKVRLSNVVSAGFSAIDTSRTIVLPNEVRQATDKKDLTTLANKMRIERTVDRDSFYWAPMIDLDLSHTRLDAGHEKGADELNLVTEAATKTVFSATPALEVGRDFVNVAGRRSTLLVRAGVEISTDRSFRVPTRFEGASSTSSPMEMVNTFEKVQGVVELGFEVKLTNRMSIKAGYEGKFHKDFNSHASSVKLRMAF